MKTIAVTFTLLTTMPLTAAVDSVASAILSLVHMSQTKIKTFLYVDILLKLQDLMNKID